MGSETTCSATFNGRTSEGKALLETSSLHFRGGFHLNVPFTQMTSVATEGGKLKIGFPDGELSLDLGKAAGKWAEKILHPPSLIDKLGVKGGEVVSVIGIEDREFLRLLEERAGRISRGRAVKGSDLIFLGAEERHTLQKLEKLKTLLKPAGAIWVIRPRGRKQITEMDVIHGGKAAGLVDTKVARFSSTHTAEKLVIPLKDR